MPDTTVVASCVNRQACLQSCSQRVYVSAAHPHAVLCDYAAGWHPVRVLGCGPAVVAATASLIRELAVQGSPDLVKALLQHGSATLLGQVLAQPLAVAWAGPGDVATLQHRALVGFLDCLPLVAKANYLLTPDNLPSGSKPPEPLCYGGIYSSASLSPCRVSFVSSCSHFGVSSKQTALKALAAAGGDPCALLPAALAGLPAEGQAIAASAVAVTAQLAAAPASPAALVATDVAGRLLAAALRAVDSAAAAAMAANKTPAAAHTPPAACEAPAPVQQHGSMSSPEVPKADCGSKPPLPSVMATALHGLAELAAAGEAEAVARQVLCGSGASPMDIDRLRTFLTFNCTYTTPQSSQLRRRAFRRCTR